MTTPLTAWRRSALVLGIVPLMLHAGPAAAESVFAPVDGSFAGQVSVAPLPPVYAGGEATLNGRNFKPGQTVTLLRDSAPLGQGSYTIGQDGNFSARLSIPDDAAVGTHPLIAVVRNPDAALVVPLKISPQLPLSGQQRFDQQTVDVAQGLYQSAYSVASRALFLTSSVGVRPLQSAAIIKVDPTTLATLARAPAGSTDAATGIFGVYGIDVDDAHGTVWATNTRQNTLAVYRQSDLSLQAQLPPGSAPRAHEVAVDAALNRAYVSSAAERPPTPGQNLIQVFDTRSQQRAGSIEITSSRPGQIFNTLGLALDPYHHKLYVSSLSTGELAIIDTRNNQVDKVIALPVTQAMGVAVDPARNRVFVASPSADGVLVLDADSGRVLRQTTTGAGALKVAYDGHSGVLYVVNRAAGTVTALNVDGEVVANLPAGSFPNHVSTDDQGQAFVISKTRGGPNASDSSAGDPVTRLSFKP